LREPGACPVDRALAEPARTGGNSGVERLSHQPVMLEEVIRLLQPRPGGKYIDLTLGLGGHSRRILELISPGGVLLGLDRDPLALQQARHNLAGFEKSLKIIKAKFSELAGHLKTMGWSEVDGMLADLGVSSLQLASAERGFAIRNPGPLDMRMDPDNGPSLAELLDGSDETGLADILRRYGQVKSPRRIAGRILRARRSGKLNDTAQLARVAAETGRKGRVHPATRVFMALRIMVNGEIEELNAILKMLPDPLKIGGRAVFISFHSLEDRLVKRRLAELRGQCSCPPGLPRCVCGAREVARVLTARSLRPSKKEVSQNPRARSASLRALERIAA